MNRPGPDPVDLTLDQKRAGVLAPVFALRTESDLGIGDTEGVRDLIDWCARHGFRLVQVLPINETGPDHSPYNTISALALDPTTIAISPERLPHLHEEQFRSLADERTLAELRAGPVCYPRVKALKHALLRVAYQGFGESATGEQRQDFAAFVRDQRWLRDYSLFRLLIEQNEGRTSWEEWPAAQSTPSRARDWLRQQPAEERRILAQRRGYFHWIQWIAWRQWQQVRRHAESRGVELMGDIPFGVSRHSADVWANRDLFDLSWSGGAPPEPAFRPDEFTGKWGQNWGIPLYCWEAHRRTRFAWWRQRVRQTGALFHLFRLDHVLGFYRVYAFPWPPQDNRKFTGLTEDQAQAETGGALPRFFPHPDDTPAHRQANCRQGEALLKMIQQAAGQTRVVAEDLGVVPDYVRPNLTKLGIPGFKIPYWERNPDSTFVEGANYPRLSVVTPATHDHLPLAAHYRQLWRTHEDCRAKHDHHGAYVTWLELQRFVKWAGGDENDVPREFTPALHESFCRQVLASNAWLAVFLITDVLADESRFNVPGPLAESNWTERLEQTVLQLNGGKTEMFARLIAASGR